MIRPRPDMDCSCDKPGKCSDDDSGKQARELCGKSSGNAKKTCEVNRSLHSLHFLHFKLRIQFQFDVLEPNLRWHAGMNLQHDDAAPCASPLALCEAM